MQKISNLITIYKAFTFSAKIHHMSFLNHCLNLSLAYKNYRLQGYFEMEYLFVFLLFPLSHVDKKKVLELGAIFKNEMFHV